jgi:hypothetical protein
VTRRGEKTMGANTKPPERYGEPFNPDATAGPARLGPVPQGAAA